MADIDGLYRWLEQHVTRGACQCGRCVDGVEHPEENQPSQQHTADLIFFKVALMNDPDREEFKRVTDGLVGPEGPNYLSLGGVVGDQGAALMMMGAGALLGEWDLLTPRTILGDSVSDEEAMTMAGNGFIMAAAR